MNDYPADLPIERSVVALSDDSATFSRMLEVGRSLIEVHGADGRVHRVHEVPALAQGERHAQPGGQRDVAFGGGAAEEDGEVHGSWYRGERPRRVCRGPSASA